MNAQVSFGSDLTYFRSISGGDRNFEGFGQFGFGLRLYRKFPEGPIESRRKGTMDGTFFDLLNINGFSIGLKAFLLIGQLSHMIEQGVVFLIALCLK